MELELNLKNHCIASEIKKLYNKSVSTYLKMTQKSLPEKTASVETTIELLKKALETLDLPALRSKYPALSGKTDTSVKLGIDSNHELYISIDTTRIELILSQ